MGVLYDKLYRSENVMELSIKDYIPSLVADVVSMFPDSEMVKTENKIEDIRLGVSLLTPLGILLNELLTNSLKYAFVGKKCGLISVSAQEKDGIVGTKDERRGEQQKGDGTWQHAHILCAAILGNVTVGINGYGQPRQRSDQSEKSRQGIELT